MTRLLCAAIAVWCAYHLGKLVERAWWFADSDTYKSAMTRRLLDSDLEIHMEVPHS